MEIRPSADLRNNYPEISKICKEERKPIFLTVNGRGDTVVMSIAEYQNMIEQINVISKLLEAKDEYINGEYDTAENVFDRLRTHMKNFKKSE